MRFTILPAVACLFAAAVAQTGSHANPPTVLSSYSVTAGKPSTFTWDPTTKGPVTLTLRSGAASDLNKGNVIATSIANSGSYTFTLPADTTRNSDYTIEISDDNDPSSVNYSLPFVVESSNTIESITPSASASAMATSIASMPSSASASTATSASSSTGATSATEQSTVSSASAKSSSATASHSTGTTSSKSMASTSGSTAAATSAVASAPSSAANANSIWNIQSGILVAFLGLMAV